MRGRTAITVDDGPIASSACFERRGKDDSFNTRAHGRARPGRARRRRRRQRGVGRGREGERARPGQDPEAQVGGARLGRDLQQQRHRLRRLRPGRAQRRPAAEEQGQPGGQGEHLHRRVRRHPRPRGRFEPRADGHGDRPPGSGPPDVQAGLQGPPGVRREREGPCRRAGRPDGRERHGRARRGPRPRLASAPARRPRVRSRRSRPIRSGPRTADCRPSGRRATFARPRPNCSSTGRA